jgi:hypothetical protein
MPKLEGLRKLVALMATMLVLTGLVVTGSIDPGTFQSVMITVLGGFFGGNAFENYSQSKKEVSDVPKVP